MVEIAGVVSNAVPTVMTGKVFSFGVHTMGRTYYIAANTADERDRWVKAICEGYKAYSQPAKKSKKRGGSKS